MITDNILLDSNAFLWLLYEPEYIGSNAQEQLRAAQTVYVSAVSLWELAIKHAKGLLPYAPDALATGLRMLGAVPLAIEPRHLEALQQIRLVQKDPFDTLLVTQSEVERTLFMTADKAILQSSYRVVDARK